MSPVAIIAWAGLGLPVAIWLTLEIARGADHRPVTLAMVLILGWICAPVLVAGGALLLAGAGLERVLRPLVRGPPATRSPAPASPGAGSSPKFEAGARPDFGSFSAMRMSVGSRRETGLAALAAGALALLVYLVFEGYVSTDPAYSLVWGREIFHGSAPDFVPGPTPHPLSNLLAVILSLWYSHAETGLLFVSYFSLAGMTVSVWCIATRIAGPAAAVIAVVLMVTREPIISGTAVGLLDIPYSALVLAAVALEIRRRRAGTPVLVLLGVAGLLRPEAWFLAGMYWLWLLPAAPRREAVRAAVIVIAAPLIWLLADLVVTGDPLFSLHGTTRAADTVTLYANGLPAVFDLPDALRNTARPGVIVAAVIGLALLLWLRREHGLTVLGILAALVIATLIPVIAGTLLNPRYLIVIIALLCVLAGVAVGGCLRRPPRAAQWAVGSVLALVALLATAPAHLDRLRDLRASIASVHVSRENVKALIDRPLPCKPLVSPNARLVPFASVWLDVDRSAIADASANAPDRGTYVFGTTQAMDGVVVLANRDTGKVLPRPPKSARAVASRGGWTLYADCS